MTQPLNPYADGTSTQKVMGNGVTAFSLPFDKGKTLVKIAVSHNWDEPSEEITIYYDDVIIRATEPTGDVSGMPVKSLKLTTDMANPRKTPHQITPPPTWTPTSKTAIIQTNDGNPVLIFKWSNSTT